MQYGQKAWHLEFHEQMPLTNHSILVFAPPLLYYVLF
uniref:Uncharacterized protein n=1 Tax=Siphoviridae sp. ctj6w2 TaxID=2827919 RepID=A0A8S5T964_9CAUD|nr:MAG TPA: hypothetical protein [Siphoviridae sp. ctj6w2]DAK23675.1 MAG TPA: hypothetical protein [Caudoviricetes sp.]